MRLQKYMAQAGVCSRRKAEELIKSGIVSVNGKIITTMGYIVDEDNDNVVVDGKSISLESENVYYAFNKPVKVITSSSDEKNRKTVMDFFPEDKRVFTVGRLDYDSSGLIFVTNDGEFANRVTHPKYECYKTYDVYAAGHINNEDINTLRKGIVIDGYQTSPAKIATQQISPNMKFMSITIREGRNRQIRKMIESVGGRVDSLERVGIGPVRLDNLKYGEYRELTKEEIDYFYSL